MTPSVHLGCCCRASRGRSRWGSNCCRPSSRRRCGSATCCAGSPTRSRTISRRRPTQGGAARRVHGVLRQRGARRRLRLVHAGAERERRLPRAGRADRSRVPNVPHARRADARHPAPLDHRDGARHAPLRARSSRTASASRASTSSASTATSSPARSAICSPICGTSTRRSSARPRTRGCCWTARRSAKRCRPSTSSRTSPGTPSARTRSTSRPICWRPSAAGTTRSCATNGARRTATRSRR